MSSLRVMVKRSRAKKQKEETEKQHFIVTENNLFIDFTTNGVQNFQPKVILNTLTATVSLTATVDGDVDLPTRNLPHCEELHATLLSSLPDYF